LATHPDLVKDVLVTNNRLFGRGRGHLRMKLLLGDSLLTTDGDAHRRQRRLAQPAFHRQRVESYGDTMALRAEELADKWRDGSTVEVSAEMMGLTLVIVANTLFGATVDDEVEEIGSALTAVFDMFGFALMPFSELFDRVPIPTTIRLRRARARLDATIYRIIAERRKSGRDHGDLLSMLLLAQDTGDEGDGGSMTDVQLRDEATTLFVAGHETTSNALTWTWYALSQNVEAESRMHAELDSVLGGRRPTAADLPKLPYTRAVLAESMRLYPPVWGMGRRALTAHTLAGYDIPRGSLVVVSPFITQRDERFFPNPESFRPERWLDDQADRPRFSYFPFGGGARQCIGEQFAWMEGVLLLATLGQRWRLRLVPGHKVEFNPLITLRPKHGMRMTLHTRT
ncbi:MAG TPA: cytochrome P450, partial [Gemmatimonadaceae bacterium]|nr:cytochrome P450 [Gemmatimonadaceae bacterium]